MKSRYDLFVLAALLGLFFGISSARADNPEYEHCLRDGRAGAQTWLKQANEAARERRDNLRIDANEQFALRIRERKAAQKKNFDAEWSAVQRQINALEGDHFDKFAPATYLRMKQDVIRSRHLFDLKRIEREERRNRFEAHRHAERVYNWDGAKNFFAYSARRISSRQMCNALLKPPPTPIHGFLGIRG